MTGWRKRDEDTDGQGGPDRAGWLGEAPQPPAATITFCPDCGGRLNASAAYAPKFCTHCGHRLTAPEYAASGLDALLQATAAAKADGGWNGANPASADVTIHGGSRTLMGGPRSEAARYDRTLMGAPRADLYAAPPARPAGSARTGAAHARVQEARRPGGRPAAPRRAARPAAPLPVAAAPPRIPAPSPPAPPAPAVVTPEAGRPTWEGAFLLFSLLLLLAVLAAAGAFWLARRHLLTLPF